MTSQQIEAFEDLRRSRESLLGQVRGLSAKVERLEAALLNETERCASAEARLKVREEEFASRVAVLEAVHASFRRFVRGFAGREPEAAE